MDTILEQQRLLHEERERVENAMVGEMVTKKSTHRDQINADHRLKALVDRYMSSSNKLAKLYEDANGDRQQEIEELRAPNEFSQFYMALKKIKLFYNKHQDDQIIPMSLEFEEMERARDPANNNPLDRLNENLVEFTDEEGYGRHLDLINIHEQYLNLKNFEKMDYLTYLDRFDKFHELPRELKLSAGFKEYLEAMITYLQDYCNRFKPLLDMQDFLDKVKADFEYQWEEAIFPGWPSKELMQHYKQAEHETNMTSEINSINLDDYSCKEELYELGLNKLKSALVALGLKCGGTLEERANRLWLTKGKSPNEIDENLKMKKTNQSKKSTSRKDLTRMKEIAQLEAIIYRMIELLEENKLATIENVQRKQSRTAGEREDSDEELSDGDLDDDDDTEVIYNPKNLPLGWDGKPIPYWLYKLHGLNITYTCEICGNATYKGPKTFQRHFAEWRHAHGMRCLGIPNTAHFANITQIEDAINLWEKLKNEKQKDKHEPLNEEEYEDSQGNVVNKKTYEDLKRQGLL